MFTMLMILSSLATAGDLDFECEGMTKRQCQRQGNVQITEAEVEANVAVIEATGDANARVIKSQADAAEGYPTRTQKVCTTMQQTQHGNRSGAQIGPINLPIPTSERTQAEYCYDVLISENGPAFGGQGGFVAPGTTSGRYAATQNVQVQRQASADQARIQQLEDEKRQLIEALKADVEGGE